MEVRVSQYRNKNFDFAVVITNSETRAKQPKDYPIHLSSFIGVMNKKAIPDWKKQGWAIFDQRRL